MVLSQRLLTSPVQRLTVLLRRCSLGTFSLNCFSATWGARTWGWFTGASRHVYDAPGPAGSATGEGRSTRPWKSSGQAEGHSGPISTSAIRALQSNLKHPPPCPTSGVMGSPLTSRQRTGISMLLVPVGRWAAASPGARVSQRPRRPPVGNPGTQTTSLQRFWANSRQRHFSREPAVLSPRDRMPRTHCRSPVC